MKGWNFNVDYIGIFFYFDFLFDDRKFRFISFFVVGNSESLVRLGKLLNVCRNVRFLWLV